jgi:hypothetical protein
MRRAPAGFVRRVAARNKAHGRVPKFIAQPARASR